MQELKIVAVSFSQELAGIRSFCKKIQSHPAQNKGAVCPETLPPQNNSLGFHRRCSRI
jgi:hypothetical protein